MQQRPTCGQALDSWSGLAFLYWREREAALRLSSFDAGRFQVYSPASAGLFVAEPVQNANAALNEPQERWRQFGISLLHRVSSQCSTRLLDVLLS